MPTPNRNGAAAAAEEWEAIERTFKASLDAGWPEESARRMLLSPKASTQAGYEALVARANAIRRVAALACKSLQSSHDMESVMLAFSLHHDLAAFRTASIRAMAEKDVHIFNTPPMRRTDATAQDVITARAEQIAALSKAAGRG